MVPQFWIKNSMEICGVGDNIFHLLLEAGSKCHGMKNSLS